MAAYRFCRTDDIGLLVEALNRCWAPYFPDQPLETTASFKRSIRDLQVWCSSCMVAFAGSDPIGVLIGAKRASATLIHKIAVHPEHVRQGHGRHLLTSLNSKLAILGPPRLVAEVPEGFDAARGLFNTCGYVAEAVLTDYVLRREADAARENAVPPGTFTIPVTVDDLVANGLLEDTHPHAAWERSLETLMARKDNVAGLAVVSDERIEAFLLHEGNEIVTMWCEEDGGRRLRRLLSQLPQPVAGVFRLSRVHAADVSTDALEAMGFHPVTRYQLYAARAQSE